MANDKHLILDNDGFFLKEDYFEYSDVIGLDYYYVQTQKRMNFGASGIDHNVSIAIYLCSRSKPLRIETGPQFLTLHGLSLGKNASESVIAKFNEISKQTFQQRLVRYSASLEERGYFDYDGKKFYADGRIEAEKWTANVHLDKPWLKRPFVIYHEKRPSGWFRSANLYAISTVRDPDIFFGLLSHLYGLSWT